MMLLMMLLIPQRGLLLVLVVSGIIFPSRGHDVSLHLPGDSGSVITWLSSLQQLLGRTDTAGTAALTAVFLARWQQQQLCKFSCRQRPESADSRERRGTKLDVNTKYSCQIRNKFTFRLGLKVIRLCFDIFNEAAKQLKWVLVEKIWWSRNIGLDSRIIRWFLFRMLKSFCHQLQSKTFEAWRHLPDEMSHCHYCSRRNVWIFLALKSCSLITSVWVCRFIRRLKKCPAVAKSAQNTTTEAERERDIVSQNLYDSVLTLGFYIFCKSKFLSASEQQLCTLATLELGKIANFIFAKKKSIFRFSATSEWTVAGAAWAGGVTLDLTLSCPPNSPPGWAALIQWTNQSPGSAGLTNERAANTAVWQLQTAGESVQCRVRSTGSLSPWLSHLSHLECWV